MQDKIELTLYTYQEHKKIYHDRPEMWNIIEYIHSYIANSPEAINFLTKFYEEGSLGFLGRLLNGLPSLDTKNIDDFAIEYLNEIKKGNFAEYTLRKISDLLHELIDCNPYNTDENNNTIVNVNYGKLTAPVINIFSGLLGCTPEEFQDKLYQYPPDQTRINSVANQMSTSLMIAMSSRFADIVARSKTEDGANYNEIANYEYLFNGVKLSESGLEWQPVEELTFKNLQLLTLDEITNRRELDPKNLETNQALRQFIFHLNTMISKWGRCPEVIDLIEPLLTMRNNAKEILYITEDIVAPDYVSKRKEMFSSLIAEAILAEETKPKSLLDKAFVFFNSKPNKLELLNEFKNDITKKTENSNSNILEL